MRLTKLFCYMNTEVKTSLYEILYSRRPKIPPAAAARKTRPLEIIKYLYFPQNWLETQQRSSRGQRSSTDKSWLNKPKMVHDWIKCSGAKSRCNVQVSYGGSWETWRRFFDFPLKSSKIKNEKPRPQQQTAVICPHLGHSASDWILSYTAEFAL